MNEKEHLYNLTNTRDEIRMFHMYHPKLLEYLFLQVKELSALPTSSYCS